jgi:oligosaccharide repeat unit polymerase
VIWFVLWVTTVILGTLLLRKSSGSLSIGKPNLHLVIYIYVFFVSSLIGSLLIVLEIDRSYIIAKLLSQDTRVHGFILVCVSFLLFALTTVIVSMMVSFDAKREWKNYWSRPIEEQFSTKRGEQLFTKLFVAMSIIAIGAVGYTLLHTKPIPLVDALLGSTDGLAKARIDAKHGYTGIVYIKNILAIGLTPLLALIAYVYKLKTKEKLWKVLFWSLFVSSVLILIYDFQKSPVLFFLIMLVLTKIYAGKLKLTMRKIVVFAAIGISYLLVMYSTAMGVKVSNELLDYSVGPIGRTILTQIAPTYIYIDRFGEVYPFLHEKGLPAALLELYNVNQVESARVLMEDLFPTQVEEGTAGVLNTLYVGEAYATFGVWGVVLASIYLGVFVQVLYMIFLRAPKHPVFIGLFVYFIINISRLMVGGFSDLVINPVLIALSMLVVFPYLIVQLKETWPGSLKKINKNS